MLVGACIAEIGKHWKGDMDAVEAVRDVRRDL